MIYLIWAVYPVSFAFFNYHFKMKKGPTPKTQAWAHLITFVQEPVGSAKYVADNYLP